MPGGAIGFWCHGVCMDMRGCFVARASIIVHSSLLHHDFKSCPHPHPHPPIPTPKMAWLWQSVFIFPFISRGRGWGVIISCLFFCPPPLLFRKSCRRLYTQTAVVWSCPPFLRSGQNHLAMHSERGKKTKQTVEDPLTTSGNGSTGLKFAKSQRAVQNRENGGMNW